MDGKEIEGQPIVVQPSSSKIEIKILIFQEAEDEKDAEMTTTATVLKQAAEDHNKKINALTVTRMATGT